MRDIEKALAKFKRAPTDPLLKLPAHYYDLVDAFVAKSGESEQPPHRAGIDHAIELARNEHSQELEPPMGPFTA
jgi:hypothetical protein